MVKYLRDHEIYLSKLLESDDKQINWKKEKKIHQEKIFYLQHERLVHLLVMLSVALFGLLSFFFTLILQINLLYLLSAIFFILTFFYILHYYQLENGVQRLYKLSNQLNKRLE